VPLIRIAHRKGRGNFNCFVILKVSDNSVPNRSTKMIFLQN